MNMSHTTTTYTPGVCNINPHEVSIRRKAGISASIMFVALLVLLLLFAPSPLFRLLLIAPAVLAVSGFLQARNKFCVGLAAAGIEHTQDGSDTARSVSEEQHAADKKRAIRINVQSLLIGTAAALATLLIPV